MLKTFSLILIILKIRLIKTQLNENFEFDLKKILIKIKVLGFSRIFLESGVKLCNNFLRDGLINDFHLFVSDKKLGFDGTNNFKKQMRLFLKNKKFITAKVNLLGEKLLTYRIK